MRSLQSLKARIDELLATHAKADPKPRTLLLLPDNGRGPAYPGPWPRIQRDDHMVLITYRVEDGQPSDEDIAKMLAGEGAQP